MSRITYRRVRVDQAVGARSVGELYENDRALDQALTTQGTDVAEALSAATAAQENASEALAVASSHAEQLAILGSRLALLETMVTQARATVLWASVTWTDGAYAVVGTERLSINAVDWRGASAPYSGPRISLVLEPAIPECLLFVQPHPLQVPFGDGALVFSARAVGGDLLGVTISTPSGEGLFDPDGVVGLPPPSFSLLVLEGGHGFMYMS